MRTESFGIADGSVSKLVRGTGDNTAAAVARGVAPGIAPVAQGDDGGLGGNVSAASELVRADGSGVDES